MREIKFRLWDIGKKKMRTPETLEQMIDNGGILRLGEWYELMQFTGLKDKNGKEIYEGDIITDSSADSKDSPYGIYWCEECLGFCSGSTKNHGYHTNFPCKSLEHCFQIIGNIYQNPELLK